MTSRNHGQPLPSPETGLGPGEAVPSGVPMPAPQEDGPALEPDVVSSAQEDANPVEGMEDVAGDQEAMADQEAVTDQDGAPQPLSSVPVSSSPEESVEERVLKLERRQEETVEDAEQEQLPGHGMSLEERVSKLEQWREAMDQQFSQQQQQLEEKDNQIRRRAAEFDNFRRRSKRDQDQQKLRQTCVVLREILPVVDNFERARKALSPEKLDTLHALDVHQDYQGIYKQLVTALKRLNVSSMKVEGQVFDPSLHEAVMRERSHQYEEDVVMEELQRGYHLEGEVLRHAVVKVSMGPGPDGEA